MSGMRHVIALRTEPIPWAMGYGRSASYDAYLPRGQEGRRRVRLCAIRRLRGEGWTLKEIGAMLAVSRETVRKLSLRRSYLDTAVLYDPPPMLAAP